MILRALLTTYVLGAVLMLALYMLPFGVPGGRESVLAELRARGVSEDRLVSVLFWIVLAQVLLWPIEIALGALGVQDKLEAYRDRRAAERVAEAKARWLEWTKKRGAIRAFFTQYTVEHERRLRARKKQHRRLAAARMTPQQRVRRATASEPKERRRCSPSAVRALGACPR